MITDDLRETAVTAKLTTRWVGRPYIFLKEVDSTNAYLKAEAVRSRLPAGTVVAADYQRQGKGRLQRRWEAPPGTALLVSLLFRPDWPPEQANWLTMIASLAMARAVERETAVSVGIKWPNDLVTQIGGAWHKIGGLLLEGDIHANRLRSAVLGIGLNVNMAPADLPAGHLPAASLLAVAGQPVSRLRLLVDFLQRVELGVDTAVSGQSPQIDWQKRLINLGQTVQVTNARTHQQLVGTAEGVNTLGHLIVRDETGKQHTITAGDVTLRQ